MTNLSAIVVIARNNAIGKAGNLLCHLPADLKHFKTITMGHTIIMGRKTFESLPKGALPGRKNVVISRNPQFSAASATVFTSLEEALHATEPDGGERFIIGGAQLYTAALPLVSTLYLTRVRADFPDADTFFPTIDYSTWREIVSEDHPADDRNPYEYSFVTLRRL